MYIHRQSFTSAKLHYITENIGKVVKTFLYKLRRLTTTFPQHVKTLWNSKLIDDIFWCQQFHVIYEKMFFIILTVFGSIKYQNFQYLNIPHVRALRSFISGIQVEVWLRGQPEGIGAKSTNPKCSIRNDTISL